MPIKVLPSLRGDIKKFTENPSLLLCACALALAGSLSACGGGSDSDPVDSDQPTAASVTACFTVPKTVNFALTIPNYPSDLPDPPRATAGPMTYNGQAVTGIKHFYLSSGLLLISKTEYWTITSNGVTDIARVDGSRTQTGGVTLPPDMRPGQTVTGSGQTANGSYALSNTLVGFEDVQLAGKTFTNTCHIRVETSLGEKTDVWVAPGYSVIKETSSNGATIQYNGDL